jgi:hypothetical protein
MLPVTDAFQDWNFKVKIFPKETIGLTITDTVASPGKQVCLRVEVVKFEKLLIGMQFGMKWDTALLKFLHINFGDISGLQLDNFGFTDTLQGKLRFLWIDRTSRGIRLDRGNRFFEVCFNVLDTVAQAEVVFSREVLDYEFIDTDLNLYNLSADNGTVSVTRNPLMRPGDTNADGIVNNFDLLPIGLAYGNTGIDRQNATTRWQAQPAADWAQTSPQSQVNYKHLDSDGNGLIELLDARAIDMNYNQRVTGFAPPLRIEPRSQGAPLYVRTRTVRPGERARFDLVLGEANQQATDVYGVAFSIEYDALLSFGNTDRVAVRFDTTWLGKVGEDLLVLQKNNPTAQRIDVALVRTNGQNRTGFGTIGQLHLDLSALTGSEISDTLRFQISQVRLLNFSEIEQAVSSRETTAVLTSSTGTNAPALAQKIRLFPNPVRDRLFIQTDNLQIEQLDLFDATGKLLQSRSNAAEILTSDLAVGMYAVRIWTKEGVVVKAFVVK